ncbi:MAG: precorrin-2 dehydrogenase [Candidatus Petromonas sp.]|jgi:precorrin-2 dehydrogenase/sirohydrochlorin ferrochelatase|nr:precorrin-2 dehydrogenase [Candidatus Petromonas sp.]
MGKYYPIMLNISGKKCTVVGGGKVAERKVDSLLLYGANVQVISPSITERLNNYSKEDKIYLIRRKYQYGDLKGSFLVYAATDNDYINRQCLEECRERGIILNVVDKPEMCDFIVPANVRRGDLNISISTNGKSPALSRKIREELEKKYPEEYSKYIDILGEIRDMVKKEVRDIHHRREIFFELVYSDVIDKYIKNKKDIDLKKELYDIFLRKAAELNEKK